MRNTETPAKRFLCVLDLLNTNAARLAKELNYPTPSSLYHIVNGVVKDISPRIAEDICACHPQISYEYLIGVKAEPLVDDNDMGFMMQKKIFTELAEIRKQNALILEILQSK